MASRRSEPAVVYDRSPRGWIMVAAAFVNGFVTFGNLKALGVLLVAITDDLDDAVWVVGWIAVLYSTVRQILAPFSAFLARLVGCRAIIIVGGIMVSTGFILACLAANAAQLAFCIVGLAGTGSALCSCSIKAVMASYFKEGYSLAVGLSLVGTSAGVMVYGPVTQVLLTTYGWRQTMVLLGAASFHLVVCGVLVIRNPMRSHANQYQAIPIAREDTEEAVSKRKVAVGKREDATKEREDVPLTDGNGDKTVHEGNVPPGVADGLRARLSSALDFAVMNNALFWLLTGCSCCSSFCLSAWLVYMVPYGRFQGLSDVQVSFVPSAFGIGDMLGAVVPSFADRNVVNAHRVPIRACVSAVILCAAFISNMFTQSFPGQLALAMVIGTSFGSLDQAVDVMMRYLTTDDRLVSIFGWQSMFSGVSGCVAGLLTGWIYEWTGTFEASFYMYSGVMLLSTLMLVANARFIRNRPDKSI